MFDLIFIVLLTETPSEFLAVFAAISAFKLGLNPNKDKPARFSWLRKTTRVISALIIFGIVLTSFPIITQKVESLFTHNEESVASAVNKSSNVNADNMSVGDAVIASLLSAEIVSAINNDHCSTVECWHEFFGDYINEYAELSIDKETAKEGLKEAIEQIKLTPDEKFFLNASLYDEYINYLSDKKENQQSNNLSVVPIVKPEAIVKNTPTYSIIKYSKAIVDDLGLGFGWAALYFTMFTAYWNGQTPGKKLLSIRVVQLDGTALSVIDSFGRYGGYGAGIATGLLGFIQIFWDANRQGIHDKISSTVVIDLTRN